MMIDPIAGVIARISSIETRFGVDRPPTTPDRSNSSATAASGMSSSDFGAVLDDALGSTLGTGSLGAVAVPWTSIRGAGPVTALQMASTSTLDSTRWPTTTTPTPATGPVDLESLDTRPVSAGTPFADLFDAAGTRHGVPPRLLASIGWVESRYQTDAVSPDGATGVMQLMPFVADHYGVDARVPAQAIDAAAQLLAEHRERFGSWELSVASYFSGAGAVQRAGNTPPTTRSHDYVRKVTERLAFT